MISGSTWVKRKCHRNSTPLPRWGFPEVCISFDTIRLLRPFEYRMQCDSSILVFPRQPFNRLWFGTRAVAGANPESTGACSDFSDDSLQPGISPVSYTHLTLPTKRIV